MVEEVLASVGLMCILRYGHILAFIRNPLTKISYFNELFSCSLCIGFWAGVAVAAFSFFTAGHEYYLLPLIAAASSWLFDFVIGALQAVENALDNSDDSDDDPNAATDS